MEQWYLIILLYFTTGSPEAKRLGGLTPYPSLAACQEEGVKMANWLTQDFAKVRWACMQHKDPES